MINRRKRYVSEDIDYFPLYVKALKENKELKKQVELLDRVRVAALKLFRLKGRGQSVPQFEKAILDYNNGK